MMFPSQAKGPLRLIVRPCLGFYKQQSASFSLAVQTPGKKVPEKAKCKRTIYSTALPFKGSNTPFPCFDLPFLSHQDVNNFSTSSTFRDAVHKQTEDVHKRTSDGGKQQLNFGIMSLEELIAMAPAVKSGYHACLTVQRLGTLQREGKVTVAEIDSHLGDVWLKEAVHQLDKDRRLLSIEVILNTLQALYNMTAIDAHVTKSLMLEVKRVMPKLSTPVLLQLLQLHLNHQESSMRREVMSQLLSMLRIRCSTVKNPKDLIFLMYAARNNKNVSKALQETLESQFLNVVQRASPKELYRMLYVLAAQSRRNTPLIRAALYHLKQTPTFALSAVQLSNLLYALSSLNVFNVNIMFKLSSELEAMAPDLTPKLVSSLLTSFSLLRWRETKMIQLLLNLTDVVICEEEQLRASGALSSSNVDSKTVKEETLRAGDEISSAQNGDTGIREEGISGELSHDCSSPDVPAAERWTAEDKVSLILSLANLNVDTPHCKELVARLASSPDVQSLAQSMPLLWLHVVWSLSVLQMVDAELAASVLAPEFWQNLQTGDTFDTLVRRTKLNNVHTAAKYELDGYMGPFLPEEIVQGSAKMLQKGNRKVTEDVTTALVNIAPLDSYTLINTTGPTGYPIDAEFYVDSQGDPVSLCKVETDTSSKYQRMALKVFEFSDLTLPASEMTGLQAMSVRHLNLQGYTVIKVYYTEFSSKKNLVEQVQFLQRKIRTALQSGASSQDKV